MREIKFRGRRIDNEEWVYGFYYTTEEYVTPRIERTVAWIAWTEFTDNGKSFNHKVEVDPATVGQYTGLKDKNGNRIFEGDVAFMDILGHGLKYNPQNAMTYIIEDNGTGRGMRATHPNLHVEEDRGWFSFWDNESQEIAWVRYLEIIGNIHDNPELIKEQGDE